MVQLLENAIGPQYEAQRDKWEREFAETQAMLDKTVSMTRKVLESVKAFGAELDEVETAGLGSESKRY